MDKLLKIIFSISSINIIFQIVYFIILTLLINRIGDQFIANILYLITVSSLFSIFFTHKIDFYLLTVSQKNKRQSIASFYIILSLAVLFVSLLFVPKAIHPIVFIGTGLSIMNINFSLFMTKESYLKANVYRQLVSVAPIALMLYFNLAFDYTFSEIQFSQLYFFVTCLALLENKISLINAKKAVKHLQKKISYIMASTPAYFIDSIFIVFVLTLLKNETEIFAAYMILQRYLELPIMFIATVISTQYLKSFSDAKNKGNILYFQKIALGMILIYLLYFLIFDAYAINFSSALSITDPMLYLFFLVMVPFRIFANIFGGNLIVADKQSWYLVIQLLRLLFIIYIVYFSNITIFEGFLVAQVTFFAIYGLLGIFLFKKVN